MAQTKAQLIDPVNGTIVNDDISSNNADRIAGSKINPVFTSNIEIQNNAPGITFTDGDQDNDFYIQLNGGALNFVESQTAANRIAIDSNSNVTITGNLIVNTGYLEMQSQSIFIIDTIAHSGDTDTKIRFPSADTFSVETAGTQRLKLDGTETVFNESGASVDFRIEGDTEPNLFFADASADRIAIGHSAPVCALDVRGTGTDFQGIRITNTQHDTNASSSAQLKLAITNSAGERSIRLQCTEMGNNSNDLAMDFYTGGSASNNSESLAMRIDNAGLVGIATTSPSSLNANSRDLVVGNGSGHRGITIFSATDKDSNIFFADGTSGDQHYRGFVQYSHTHDEMRLGSSGDNTLILENATNNRDVHVVDGDIVFDTSGKGLNFSARSGSAAGATSSILYDYEEGTYTPTIGTGGSFTYTVQAGHYVKVGRLVRFDFFIQIAAGTSNNVMYRITLPFACDTTGTHRGSGAVTYVDVGNAPVHTPNLYIGSTYAELYAGPTQYKSTAGTNQAGKYIIGGGTFHTAS